MNDFSAKPSSALVVADRNAHRPGGCVGIFFKLFDWNRKFGKKKLLPKKLLAPTRANQVSKKFNADEKLPMPKHMMIADGKGGVYPGLSKNVKGGVVVSSDQMNETKSPSLVARLMGLESMPLVESKIPDKSSNYGNYDQRNGRFVGELESGKEIWNLEKGCLRHEHQPQKIQKTGVSERRPVNRFGADALQIRNVLSRSRKRHPKLASPVKSPRAVRNSSRLMDAAAKILEPGLQARTRAKCSLTYSNHIREERMMIDLPTQSSYDVCNPRGFEAQSSCQNCGHLVEPMDLKSDGTYEKESQVVLLRSGYQSPNVENQWAFAKKSPFHHERDVSPPIALNQRARVLSKSQTQVVNSGDRVPSRSRRVSTSSTQTKDFIALNRNVNQSTVRFPRKPNNLTEARRQYPVPKSGGLSTQRNIARRRTAASCKQVVSTSSSGLTMDRSIKSRVVIENRVSVNASSANITCVKSRSGAEGSGGVSQSKDIDVVSFSFSSPMKSKLSRVSPSHADNKGMESSNSVQMKDDAIGALLEQKLKELTDQAEYESRTEIAPQGRTTASILQELITALTVERPISPETNDNLSSRTSVMHKTSQGETMAKLSTMRLSSDRLSPGSVLEASFSNDSCVSSSRDDASGHILQCDDMDISYDEPRFIHPDIDLIDSASSTITKETNTYTLVPVTHLLDHISGLLQTANLSNIKSYTGYTNEVLLNAEMVFGNASHPAGFVDFLVGPFLDELETLAAAAWRNTVILGFEVTKGESRIPLRTFLFDCLVECLDLRFGRYSEAGFREWCKLLSTQMNTEALLQVFDYEVRKWASLAMMSTDEVIHWEMSTWLGKWTDFEVEAFEAGTEISEVIFESLIDEVVAEFL